MKWDLYPQNLMAEYHVRYGGYGGIGYYMVSDSYIALMSRFTLDQIWGAFQAAETSTFNWYKLWEHLKIVAATDVHARVLELTSHLIAV